MFSKNLLPLLGLSLLIGCAAPATGEELSGTDSALSGNVAAGTVTKTTTDGLRLRRTPDKSSDKSADKTLSNIVGLIPIGTQVKIVTGTPTNGFYQIKVLDAALVKALKVDTGWVFGDYLEGKAEEPADPAEDVSLTGTHDVDTIATVDFIASDCTDLKDDMGRAMAPTVDDYLLSSGHPYAVIAIDTNTFSYGSSASIEEIDQASSFNPGGVKVPLKIVKTSRTQPAGGFTVTICMSTSSKALLPTDANGQVTLHVH